MADFKNELSPALIHQIGNDLASASTAFNREAFERQACSGLDELEMKARIDWIAQALTEALPPTAEDADQVIRGALEAGGLGGWASLPVNAYVALAMLDRPDLGLPLLAALTPRYTAEFAIRPFIESQYDATMNAFQSWVTHPDEHVRRLVSEGSRPRLPWGQRLTRFIEDPTPTLTLLDALVNDESLYVRRSVANHLNDIAKDHPDLVLKTAHRWAACTTRGDFVVRHGLRTLVKKGHPEALAILGFDHNAQVTITDLHCTPQAVKIGETATITFTLKANENTRAAIDYVVHYQGMRGAKAGKVFKLAVRDLPAKQPIEFARRHSFAHVSVRTIRPGPHKIEIQVNGRVIGETIIEVAEASTASPK
jgi:DNA alkylation repair enzyme